jgi:2-hydroxy-3-keto-5-methylthiopentenyl-1-phosphate phosphatase
MAPLIRSVISNILGEEESKDIEIISNHVKIEENGKWRIQYRHPERWAPKFRL